MTPERPGENQDRTFSRLKVPAFARLYPLLRVRVLCARMLLRSWPRDTPSEDVRLLGETEPGLCLAAPFQDGFSSTRMSPQVKARTTLRLLGLGALYSA